MEELKNLDLTNPVLKNNIENLNLQKNQLEIEKNDLEKKYKELSDQNEILSKRLDEFRSKEKVEKENK